jgi:hypothetical protein
MFMSHVEFVIEHPGVPRMMFGELQRAEASPAKRHGPDPDPALRGTPARRAGAGKAGGEIAPEVDVEAAATLFIGTIQGLVMQSMLSGDIKRMRAEAPGVFAIYQRGIASRK